MSKERIAKHTATKKQNAKQSRTAKTRSRENRPAETSSDERRRAVDPEQILDSLPDLEKTTHAAQTVRLVGPLSRSEGRLAIGVGQSGRRHLVVRIEDVLSLRLLSAKGAAITIGEVELSLDAMCEVHSRTRVGTVVGRVLSRRLRQRHAQRATPSRRPGASPFVLATPHHATTAYNPPALGGNLVFANRGDDDFEIPKLIRDPIHLGPGGTAHDEDESDLSPVPPNSEEDESPPMPPVPKFLRDPITLIEALGPPHDDESPDDPSLDPPAPPPIPVLTYPWLDPIYPQPPPPQPKAPWQDMPKPSPGPFDFLDDYFDEIKPTGQFGDPWGVDIQLDF